MLVLPTHEYSLPTKRTTKRISKTSYRVLYHKFILNIDSKKDIPLIVEVIDLWNVPFKKSRQTVINSIFIFY